MCQENLSSANYLNIRHIHAEDNVLAKSMSCIYLTKGLNLSIFNVPSHQAMSLVLEMEIKPLALKELTV